MPYSLATPWTAAHQAPLSMGLSRQGYWIGLPFPSPGWRKRQQYLPFFFFPSSERPVKWALGSITTNKASGGDRIPGELFQILKDDAVKVLHSICLQTRKTKQWSQDWKRSVFIPIPKKGNAKECSNYLTIALISHASKVMLKILQARLQQYVNCELPDVQAGFRKGRGTIKLSTSAGSLKKQESSRKTSISALLTTWKPLTEWITINCGKFWKRWDYQTTWPAFWEICMQVRKQRLELDMEQQTGSK